MPPDVTAKQKKRGICYLVGAGPGDPGLITVKGMECLRRADVVVYDYLSNPALLRHAPEDAVRVYAGKKAKDHTLSQDEINRVLVESVRMGKTVVRLKGGDPIIFGRGGEEAQELKAAGLRYEIVPGITSSIAGPIYAGIPVTHRESASALTIFTGHEDPTKGATSIDYRLLAKSGHTLVMLMGVERLEPISQELMAGGADPQLPVALIRWATTGRQETITGKLASIAALVREAGFKAPAVAVFGEVVNHRESLDWFESRPLLGKRIVVTRTRKQASGLVHRLSELGADVLEIPTIRIDPSPRPAEFHDLVEDAHQYDWLVFTSPNGVDAFFEQFFKIYQDLREIGGVRIAAIGPATAARVKAYHLSVDLQPEEFVAEAVLEAFGEAGGVENLRMLLVRAEKARDVLPDGLAAKGAIVDVAPAYRTVPETEDPTGARTRFVEEGADLITFTSSSTVEHFLDLGLPWPPQMMAASIGPITSQTLREKGHPPQIEAKQYDIPGLVEAILEALVPGSG